MIFVFWTEYENFEQIFCLKEDRPGHVEVLPRLDVPLTQLRRDIYDGFIFVFQEATNDHAAAAPGVPNHYQYPTAKEYFR